MELKDRWARFLKEAGLPEDPQDPRQIVGRQFYFDCPINAGHFIAGTITGFNLGYHEGVELFVSVPATRGFPIHSLRYMSRSWEDRDHKKWYLIRLFKGEPDVWGEGDFQLL